MCNRIQMSILVQSEAKSIFILGMLGNGFTDQKRSLPQVEWICLGQISYLVGKNCSTTKEVGRSSIVRDRCCSGKCCLLVAFSSVPETVKGRILTAAAIHATELPVPPVVLPGPM